MPSRFSCCPTCFGILASAVIAIILGSGPVDVAGEEPAEAAPAKAQPKANSPTTSTLRIISRALGVGELPAEPVKEEPATHKQLTKIPIRGKDGKGTLQTFCVGAEDQIYAVVSAPVLYGPNVQTNLKAGGEIHILSAEGKPVGEWTTDFTPQRIAAAPNGDIFVGGSGKLARFDKSGKLIAEAASPHVEAVLKDKESLREQAAEQLKEQIEQYKQQVEQLQETLKNLEEQKKEQEAAAQEKPAEKKPAEDKPAEESPASKVERKTSTASGRIVAGRIVARAADPKVVLDNQIKQYKQIIQSYTKMAAQLEKKSPDDVVNEITQRLQKIHAITVSGENLYVATAVTKGYGFAVWRMDLDFKQPKQIISGLSGCCGQMDVQARGDDLWVAENSRHAVVHYSKEGKKLGQFGSRAREATAASFGGCCNPMNVCFTPEGNILTSESEGKVKCFTPEGKYVGLAGSAAVSGGCKNVAIGSSSDGKYIYFYDLGGSQIIILAKQDDAKPAG